ncbi:hypothetical protein [Palaeococcus sp. (in: euryarchaeotes)]
MEITVRNHRPMPWIVPTIIVVLGLILLMLPFTSAILGTILWTLLTPTPQWRKCRGIHHGTNTRGMLMGDSGMCIEDINGWFLLLVPFRLVFRFLIFLDLELTPIFFLNIPLFLKMPSGFLLLYLFGMLLMEAYLILNLRKKRFPTKILLVYFGIATILEFPYVPFSGLFSDNFSGIFLFVLPWYLSALIGLLILLKPFLRRF